MVSKAERKAGYKNVRFTNTRGGKPKLTTKRKGKTYYRIGVRTNTLVGALKSQHAMKKTYGFDTIREKTKAGKYRVYTKGKSKFYPPTYHKGSVTKSNKAIIVR